MLFGRDKKSDSKTVLILDIENGSVGSALIKLEPGKAPGFLGSWREHMPVHAARGAESLAEETRKIISALLPRLSLEAVRNGGVSEVAVFMSPPWGRPNLESGRPDFVPHLQEMLAREASPYFGGPLNFYTSAGAAAQGLRALLPYEDKYLLCVVTHEMTELLLIYNGAVAGHASMPHGVNLPLRTLKTHGGLSEPEARSLLRLGHGGGAARALDSSTEYYAEEFKNAARELLDAYVPQQVWVVSPAGEYFARALSHESLSDLFPQGGVVRALRPRHFEQHLPGSPQDLFLILEALYLRYTL